ncbi:MAG: DUF2199 domain-containing protein [Isosphaeraceae bacterium]|nr:DUF2199 domain-containing protein [Isosphaeraceae bacterium]
MAYHCTICGQRHDELPHLGIDRPAQWWDVPEEERERRIKLTSDTCVVDDRDYLVRGVIEIPVEDYGEPFGFGVWVSQTRENYFTYLQNFDSDQIGPFFGWLCTHISFYKEETLLLKTRAHFRTGGLRPFIELEPTDHPLAVDQRTGISLARAWEIVHHFHPAGTV